MRKLVSALRLMPLVVLVVVVACASGGDGPAPPLLATARAAVEVTCAVDPITTTFHAPPAPAVRTSELPLNVTMPASIQAENTLGTSPLPGAPATVALSFTRADGSIGTCTYQHQYPDLQATGLFVPSGCSGGAQVGGTYSAHTVTLDAQGPTFYNTFLQVTIPLTATLADDDNPCTIEECTLQGPQRRNAPHGTVCAPETPCEHQRTCTDDGFCTHADPKPLTSDNNQCTLESCDPATGETVHTPIAHCDPTPTEEGQAFETRASLLGRVVDANGAPIASYTLRVYDAPTEAAPSPAERQDVALTAAADGSFRARLTSMPETEPERTPPRHVLVHVETPTTLTAIRDAYLHPGSVVDLGEIALVARDAQSTTIGAGGGVATDSQGLVEVNFPPGAIAQDTPIRITAF